jgi:spermidine/putrescine transport system permease protein
MKRSKLPLFITIGVIVFFYLPILLLFVTSFNESRFGETWAGFSFKWYQQLLREKDLWEALKNSFIIGISATVISTVLGTLAALSLYQYKSKLQKVHHGLVYIPLAIPDILMGIGLLLFFVILNFQLGLFTVFIAHTTFCLSYVTMVLVGRLQNFDLSIVEAGQDLGANWWEIFWRVKVPFLMPGIMAGALLAFTLSIDDFVITFFVAGPGTTTLPLYVYSMIKFGSPPLINALSVVILVVTFFIIWLTQRLSNRLEDS